MVAGIDMSLDDIIRSSAEAAATRRRFTFVRNPVRATPYPVPRVSYGFISFFQWFFVINEEKRV